VGSDAPRFGGGRLCSASPLATPAVEAAVWAEVRTLLEDPRRVEQEYTRRWSVMQATTPPAADLANTAHLSKLRQGLARLLESYTDGFISNEEFEPRISRLRQRITQFAEELRRERADASALQEMQLLMGQMEEFAARVREGLADADWPLRRDIIRALVKRIEVPNEHITIVFRVGAQTLGPAPPNNSWQHWLPRLSVHAPQARPSALGCAGDGVRRSTSVSRVRLN
jgi:site-specific DNA recombinase